ncbi:hypothetical protein HMPREF9336_01031 [Segniliparus rugosus ATCC BAA-974]|uniref:DJ-1/PfpI domain-containing protein n=1 Tax=Segniliparus rugosus (strain ATCC BAA-974 / DSM 45345 / CCUG 50838 / CIP 108380 / JCM 13579 / CDC 945) TaxID=679197 RepID=E5XNK2_SEGRC|nr:hypothetical protein HMPREF9336_01031 [Segniliparus rugosus ATCC BAA-974]
MQIVFVVYPGMTALDMIGPYEVLRALPDAEVRFVWHEPGPIVTDSGVLLFGATHSFAETSRPDIVLVPGSGTSTASTARDEALLAWLREVHETTRWTLSVCSGSVILAAAGLLRGKKATSHWRALDLLRPFGASPQPHSRIVSAGKITTAAGVSAGMDLALFMVGEIAGPGYAKALQLALEYDPQPPFDSGHMSKASLKTKTQAHAIMAKHGMFKPAEMAAGTRLLWDAALMRVRQGRRPAPPAPPSGRAQPILTTLDGFERARRASSRLTPAERHRLPSTVGTCQAAKILAPSERSGRARGTCVLCHERESVSASVWPLTARVSSDCGEKPGERLELVEHETSGHP